MAAVALRPKASFVQEFPQICCELAVCDASDFPIFHKAKCWEVVWYIKLVEQLPEMVDWVQRLHTVRDHGDDHLAVSKLVSLGPI